MDFLIAAILGFVQGVTEFMPVSSAGHLVILERLTGFQIPVLTFHVFLHAGTMLAIISVMRKEFTAVIQELASSGGDMAAFAGSIVKGGDGSAGLASMKIDARKPSGLILAAALPSLLIGFLLYPAVSYCAQSALVTGAFFFVTGILLLVTDRVKTTGDTIKDLQIGDAALIGVAQGLSVFPGFSRAAATISSGVFAGLGRRSAIRFSYMISVPVTAGALVMCVVYGIRDGIFTGRVLMLCLTGTGVSALTGAFCIRRFLNSLRKRKLRDVACYCFVMGFAAVLISYV